MALQVWRNELTRNLHKALLWHAGMAAIAYPEGEELLEKAQPTIVQHIKEALQYFGFSPEDATATILAYLYPSMAAEIWIAAEVVGNARVAREQARSIVSDAMMLGYIGEVTLRDLEEYNPVWWREKQLEDYEKLLEQSRNRNA